MYIIKLFAIGALVATVAGCDQLGLNTDAERGVAGALGGAVVADALGGDVLAGALVGGAAGTFCDDLNIVGCIPR